ncbi:uncharacterized protein LOC126741934 [Anthonomus grandis grandis]|uniref:uncharacterized protein LOC126741934 n=1 Tax=Anthonomus grandis grandis TaxID=2921223 RepID=UPI0021664522|nr:uncharacterized protein LOC126741934 [Anthonomus grandis grandis]
MPDAKSGRNRSTKATSTDFNRTNIDTENSIISETESEWKCPGLRRDVQTIIDIMGPPLCPTFNYNTSSEADNEESVFSNSKISSEKCKGKSSNEEDSSEKTDTTSEAPSKLETDTNISTAADINTTTQSATLDGFVDSKMSFPYVENFCTMTPYGAEMCPPPLIPANVCINSECLCPQVASILHGDGGGLPVNYSNNNFRFEKKMPQVGVHSSSTNLKLTNDLKDAKSSVINWFKSKVQNSKIWEDSCANGNTNEYYKMNVKKKRGCYNSPPRRVVFELVSSPQKEMNVCNSEEVCIEELPAVKESKHKKNLKNESLQIKNTQQNNILPIKKPVSDDRVTRKPVEKTTYSDAAGTTRVDVYYFDHGSFKHYETTDAPPHVTSDGLAEKTEKHTTRFWAEIFGAMHIGFSFVTSFILQFFRFILYSIVRPLTIGFVQLASDYFFKPFLATMFNAILQPLLIFIYNILSTLRDICDPISEGLGYFIREIAVLIRSFRIVEVYQENCKCTTSSKENICEKKSKKNSRCIG